MNIACTECIVGMLRIAKQAEDVAIDALSSSSGRYCTDVLYGKPRGGTDLYSVAN